MQEVYLEDLRQKHHVLGRRIDRSREATQYVGNRLLPPTFSGWEQIQAVGDIRPLDPSLNREPSGFGVDQRRDGANWRDRRPWTSRFPKP
jgi:hypothetical protein